MSSSDDRLMIDRPVEPELQALAQIALPAVRRAQALGRVLPCETDRVRLRSAVGGLIDAGFGDSDDLRLEATLYLARGGVSPG